MRALVTGAGGFLGGAIARLLLERGDSVRTFSRSRYERLADCEQIQGDIADAAAVRKACEGVEVVFHVAGKVGLWGRYRDFYETNVGGTRSVLAACQDLGIRRLVFTGSPSVVFDGRDVAGVDESAPYPDRFDSHYSRTKAIAEDMALSAASEDLGVVSLRPHLIWGPGDQHIAPRIIAKAKAGRLRRIGAYDKLVDTTYVDDAARAHILAAGKLAVDPAINGRAYFLSSGDPRPIWEIVNGILAAADLAPIERAVPLPVARAAAFAYEAAWRALFLKGEPPLTRFLVSQLTTAHWFDISAAKRDLGYAPTVTIEEGLRRLRSWLSTSTYRPG